jgi:hypothetical protein
VALERTVSSREALIDTLAVLRRPQTAADRRVPIPPGLAHRRDMPFAARLGAPDRSLIRIAARTPWGNNVIFIPLKPRPAPAPRARRQEVLFVFDGGGGCCDTAKEIRTVGGGGISGTVGRGRIGVVLVLPDGVDRISIVARYPQPVTISVDVHDNVAAFYAPGYPRVFKSKITWYGRSGKVIRRLRRQAF